MKKYVICLFVVLCGLWCRHGVLHAQTFPAVSEEKEISKSALSNSITVLPDWDHEPISIFSFSRGELRKNPWIDEEKPKTEEEIFQQMQNKQIGDIVYDNAEGGGIVVWSRKVQSLGEGLLQELPDALEPKLEKKDWVPTKPGSRYLIQTVEGKYAIFRVLESIEGGKKQKIQWIYQPDGSTTFSSKQSFLDHPLGNVEIVYHRMGDIIDWLQMRGLRVCFEPVIEEHRSKKTGRLNIRNATCRNILDAMIKAIEGYSWSEVDGTNIIAVTPSSGSRLAYVSQVKASKSASWLEIVNRLKLREHGVEFPPEKTVGIDPDLPADKRISIDLTGNETAMEVLAKICWAYGDGMYFELWPDQEGNLELYFKVP